MSEKFRKEPSRGKTLGFRELNILLGEKILHGIVKYTFIDWLKVISRLPSINLHICSSICGPLSINTSVSFMFQYYRTGAFP